MVGLACQTRETADAQIVEHRARAFAHRIVIEDLEETGDDRLRDLPSEEDVRRNVEIVAQRKVLIDRLNTEPLGILGRFDADRVSVYQDVALVNRVDTGQNLDESGLARPIVADDGKDLPAIEVELDAFQGGDGSEGLLNALDLDDWIHPLRQHLSFSYRPS